MIFFRHNQRKISRFSKNQLAKAKTRYTGQKKNNKYTLVRGKRFGLDKSVSFYIIYLLTGYEGIASLLSLRH